MKKTLIVVSILLPVCLLFLSCGSSNNNGGSGGSGLKFRAFITQDVNSVNVSAAVQILDAQKDLRAPVAGIAAGAQPGMMVVTPNRVQTLVFSPSDSKFTQINNTSETGSGGITLPGFTESFVVSPDSQSAYIAIPTATNVGQSPGGIAVIDLNTSNVKNIISCPAPGETHPPCFPDGTNYPYRYLAISNSGTRVLAFSQDSNVVAVITPSNIGTQVPVITFVEGFDRPVTAFFTPDDNTAFVVNCGPECGGSQASVQKIDFSQTTPVADVASPVPAGSFAVVSGSTMYLAGTPVPASPCTGQTTAATSCGLLSVFDLVSMSVVNTDPIIITDGYHNRMALGADGQLFVGAHSCTEIIAPIPAPPEAEVRGCLSIFNTQTGAVVIPPANGDVTGIQPISTRHVVYLAQGGQLQIYDTTTDKLQELQIDISGEIIDVKTVDF